MNQTASSIQLVSSDALPDYPIPRSERLESHFFIEFHHNRWLASSFRLLASPDVKSAGFDLFFIAQNQAPVGTLPVDDTLLARLLGLEQDAWDTLKRREISPLYNWTPCNCEGEVRLHHPVVTEMALKALGLKLKKLEDREKGRERKRLIALRVQIITAGGSARMAEDDGLIGLLDVCLVEEFKGQNRTPAVVRAALEMVTARRG